MKNKAQTKSGKEFVRDLSSILGNVTEDLERIVTLIFRSEAIMRKCLRSVR